MNRETHVRFSVGLRMKIPQATRLKAGPLALQQRD
jgi:hypothetical protein